MSRLVHVAGFGDTDADQASCALMRRIDRQYPTADIQYSFVISRLTRGIGLVEIWVIHADWFFWFGKGGD